MFSHFDICIVEDCAHFVFPTGNVCYYCMVTKYWLFHLTSDRLKLESNYYTTHIFTMDPEKKKNIFQRVKY